MLPLDYLTFASDAELLVLGGAGLLLIAAMASFAERRRVTRSQIDRVGWMPWTGLFLTCAVVGVVMLAFGIPGLFQP